jgi:hypothetical protein
MAAVSVAAVTLAHAGVAGGQPPTRRSADQREQRYQIGVMEGILEEAVEHGARVTRDRLQAVLPPADMLLREPARARGFRLEGYGVFFDVVVPTLDGTLPWSLRLLDQNGLGLSSALEELRAFVEKSSNSDLAQALKRIELQVGALLPTPPAAAPAPGSPTLRASSSQVRSGSAASTPGSRPVDQPPADPILNDPEGAYREEIVSALMDAMLEHSRGLGLAPEDWLTVAAKRDEDRPRLSPIDTDARTVQIRVRGADLSAFLAGQLSRDEARKRMEVRVF